MSALRDECHTYYKVLCKCPVYYKENVQYTAKIYTYTATVISKDYSDFILLQLVMVKFFLIN